MTGKVTVSWNTVPVIKCAWHGLILPAAARPRRGGGPGQRWRLTSPAQPEDSEPGFTGRQVVQSEIDSESTTLWRAAALELRRLTVDSDS